MLLLLEDRRLSPWGPLFKVSRIVDPADRRKHIKPQFSQTILLPNVYNNPGHTPEGAYMNPEQLQANFDAFYEDFFM